MVRGERKIAMWDIRIEGATYQVPVYMVQERHDYDHYREEGHHKVHFRAEYPKADLRLTDVNIEALRIETEKYLANWAAIEWGLYLYIDTHVDEGKIEFEYDWYAIGTRRDGAKVHVHVGHPTGCGPFCKNEDPAHEHDDGVNDDEGTWSGKWDARDQGYHGTSDGLPETGVSNSHSYQEDRSRMRALVPATIESFQACWKFKKAIQSLGMQIQARFAPGEVEATLADIVKMIPQLPAPKKVEDHDA